MIAHFSSRKPGASARYWTSFVFLAVATFFLNGCATTGGISSGNFHTTAYAPASKSDVSVKVSLDKQNVYVMEGDRILMATPICVGKAGYPTPTGHFAVISKDKYKRSSEYGYWTDGSRAFPGEAGHSPGAGWSYVGYPMAFWVEFTPGFGFHEGPIWPFPKSHGCIHIHPSASAKFFELVDIGTPVDIADSQPEDSRVDVPRPDDYRDPDPPASLMISQQFYDEPRDTTLLPLPAQTSGN